MQILTGIPIPDHVDKNPGRKLYPFEDLEVGQSFFVAGKSKNNFGQTVKKAAQKLGRNFVYDRFEMKKDDGSTDSGIMVWRTPDSLPNEQ